MTRPLVSQSPYAPNDTDRTTVENLRVVERFQSALRRGERAGIVENGRQLISQRAPLGGQWLQLAMILAVNGEITLAREACRRLEEAFPGDPIASFGKVDVLAQAGAWDEVMALLRAWPGEQPKPATYAYTRGTAALYLGDMAEARLWLEKAVRERPRDGTPWLSLNLVIDFAREPELAELVLASERIMQSCPPPVRGSYYYTRGKVHADRGEPALAFAAFGFGAQLMKAAVPYNRAQDRASVADAVEGYDAARIAEIARRQSEPTDRAIFVMGLPRSGTTLVEQILTSHSAVSDGGEIYRLPLLAKDVGGASYAALNRYAEETGPPAAARLWQHWLDERFPAPGRIVAKTLINSRYLGVAAGLLPEAPLIWLTRDPLDCAWSCFRTRFAGEAAWSYDLEDIAFHFRLEDELRARWRDILGERLLVVPYEKLATDPEPWIRRILAHCGLPEEQGPFAPHENARAVTTTSAAQVRQPINRAGIGTAEPYRAFLAPFIEAYSR